MIGRQTISRILYPGRKSRNPGGDHSSRSQVSPKLKRPTRKLNGPFNVSLFGLAPCGVYQADPSPDRWCALTAPFHPYRNFVSKIPAVCFLWHFPSLTGPRATRHIALRSSDFPLPAETGSDHPSARHPYDFMLWSKFCNSSGKGEWNFRGTWVEGWLKPNAAACRKYRFSSPCFLTN